LVSVPGALRGPWRPFGHHSLYYGYYSHPANSYHEPRMYRARKAYGYTRPAYDVGVTYLYAPRHPFAPRWWGNRYVGWRTW
jgi:hypothetical protein